MPTKLYQLPVFLRGGSAIMMYESLPSAKSIKVSGNWFLKLLSSINGDIDEMLWCLDTKILSKVCKMQ